jgi:hypothetical protein
MDEWQNLFWIAFYSGESLALCLWFFPSTLWRTIQLLTNFMAEGISKTEY